MASRKIVGVHAFFGVIAWCALSGVARAETYSVGPGRPYASIDAVADSLFISDEIYHGIQYGPRAVSALEISDEVYVINSFSKYFSMTGWRIGWMVVPPDHVRRIERLMQNMFICAPHASQVAALAALDAGEELERNTAVYAANRGLILEGLRETPFGRIAPPDGAIYVYSDVSEMEIDSRVHCERLLLEAGVAVTPGLDFDPQRGSGSIRFSYAATTPDIAEGLRRLKEWARG
jgi:aspartate/methionine/tyrosine aminotransferase